MASVTLKRVTKMYGDVAAVNDVTLEVRDKEFLVLVGPSGCGKSTTLRLVAGLEDASGGEIVIGERLVNDVPPKDRDIAMVFQSYALYPHMSVHDNMAFGLKLRHVPGKEIERRVQDAAEILGLDQLLHRKPRELSGGQRQRVALGRAIVREPKVFLMDEPLSNLDAKLRVQTRAELIKLYHRLQTTVVYVTHDQVEAMTMGSRIAVMKDGLLQQLDTPQTLYDHPANMFVAEFIGSPAMNFMSGKLVGSDDEIWIDTGDVRLRVARKNGNLVRMLGRDVVAGVRPEHIVVVGDAAEPETGRRVGNRAGNGHSEQNGHFDRLPAHVEVVEPLGSEAIVYLKVGGQGLVSRTPYRSSVRIGGAVEAVVDTEWLYLFDAQTQRAIG